MFTVLSFAAHAADIVMVRSAGRNVPTAYADLTPKQKARVDQALGLLRQPQQNRPRASRRLRNHPSIRAAVALQSSARAKDIDCTYDEDGAAGCWIGDTFCGVVWAGSLEVGCW